MQQQIDPRKVAGVVATVLPLVGSGDFTYADIIIGLGEVLGRLIVNSAGNAIHAQQLIEVVEKHMVNTVKIGFAAQRGAEAEIEQPRIKLLN
jgi:hypothetical protein